MEITMSWLYILFLGVILFQLITFRVNALVVSWVLVWSLAVFWFNLPSAYQPKDNGSPAADLPFRNDTPWPPAGFGGLVAQSEQPSAPPASAQTRASQKPQPAR